MGNFSALNMVMPTDMSGPPSQLTSDTLAPLPGRMYLPDARRSARQRNFQRGRQQRTTELTHGTHLGIDVNDVFTQNRQVQLTRDWARPVVRQPAQAQDENQQPRAQPAQPAQQVQQTQTQQTQIVQTRVLQPRRTEQTQQRQPVWRPRPTQQTTLDFEIFVDEHNRTEQERQQRWQREQQRQRRRQDRIDEMRESTLEWFAAHGRTVQAPALNIEQMLRLPDDRRAPLVERVTHWFRLLQFYRIHYHQADRVPYYYLRQDVAWQSSDGDDGEEVDDDPSDDSDAPHIFYTDWVRQATSLSRFARNLAPDDRVVFHYFWKHPEAIPPSAEVYALRQADGTVNATDSYEETLLVAYANVEQIAINRFLASITPEQSAALDETYLEVQVDDDAETDIREDALPEQWTTLPDEPDWFRYTAPLFHSGHIPPLGYRHPRKANLTFPRVSMRWMR